MKKNIYVHSILLALLALIVSCSSVNQVSTASKIQNRKYTKGFYISNLFHKHKNNVKEQKENNVISKIDNQQQQLNNEELTLNSNSVNPDVEKSEKSKSPIADVVKTAMAYSKNVYKSTDNKSFSQVSAEHKIAKKQFQSNFISAVKQKSNHKSGSNGGGPGLSIASFALGIFGLLLFGIICGVLAIIFGATAIASGRDMKGLAIAGLILGIIDIIGVLIILGTL